MITESVIPDDGGREGKWVALFIAMILLVAGILLPYHQFSSEGHELAVHQVSVEELKSPEQAMIRELRLAHEEIRNIHQDNLELDGNDTWPLVSELEALWLAPFVQDKSWEHKGKHHWQQVAPGIFLGIRQLRQGSASVILNSLEAESVIWFALNEKMTSVNTGIFLSESALIEAGWQQVSFVAEQDNHLY